MKHVFVDTITDLANRLRHQYCFRLRDNTRNVINGKVYNKIALTCRGFVSPFRKAFKEEQWQIDEK